MEPSGTDLSESWTKLAETIEIARAEVAALAPDAATAAEGEAYVARVVAVSLGANVLGHLFADGGLGRALPCYGGPNPDYIMQHSGIDPTVRYRLTGRLNGSERVGVGLYAIGARGETLEVGYRAFDADNCDAEGGFTLDLAPDASGREEMAVPPEARILLMRTLHRASGEQPARLMLEGGSPQRGLALVTGTPQGALQRAAGNVLGVIRQFLVWTRVTSAKPNRLDDPPPELAAEVQGDRDTHYYLGYYDLADGEYLEVAMPAELPGYWSLHAYNHWLEWLQSDGVHDRNARSDADGRIRVAIGSDVPAGLPNRIDTLGRRRGMLICRIIGAAERSIPVARVVRCR
ncbi:MAG TPA: hypothetical protein VGE05_08750 [Novosphingobium sp.]